MRIGIIRRVPRGLGPGFVETQLLKIQKGNIGLNHPNQMVIGNEFIQRE